MSRASVWVVVGLAFAGCRSGSTGAPPAVSSAPAPPGVVPPQAGPSPSGSLPTVRAVLDDPRLAVAKDLERSKDFAGAASFVARSTPPDMPAADRCAWDFVAGRLYAAAGSLPEATAAFDRASAPTCPLAGYAKLRGAQATARRGAADDAIARARSVPVELPAQDEVKLVLAESFAAKGDRAQALPLWRAWLSANPHGARWVDTSVRIATAFLDGVDGPADAHAREALDLATKVVVEAPKLADASGATQARARAVALLRTRDPSVTDALGDVDRARQAQAWLDQGEPTRAYELANQAVLGAKVGASVCRAAQVRASAAAKVKSKPDAWAEAVTACDKDEQLVTVLYTGAKARAGKDPKTAIDWFGRLEQRFPSHRLADDARYRAALLTVQGTEDERARGEEMLRTLPDTYPSGDMRGEALFRLALAKMQKGEWAAAVPSLDRILELEPDDRHWATAGRAEYFRARAAAALGDKEGEKAHLTRVIDRHPLAYYMLLAHARLAGIDAPLAAKTLKDAVQRDAAGTFPSHPLAVLGSAGVLRGARLLEVGELDLAKREFLTAGATSEGAESEAVWAIGALYNQAGLPEIGHQFSRGRLTDHLAHYPEGRWRVPWEVAYPRAFEPLVVKACEKNAIPRPLTWAVMREESSFIADVKSHANAIGLMQLVSGTAKWIGTGANLPWDDASLKKPEISIELGSRLLGKLRTTHGHPALAIGAYNGGSGAMERWVTGRSSDDVDLFVELVPWDETRNYVKRVLSSQAAYAYLYDASTLGEPLGLPLRLAR